MPFATRSVLLLASAFATFGAPARPDATSPSRNVERRSVTQAGGELAVASMDAVLVFDTGAPDGDARPLRTIVGPHTGLRGTADVAEDSAGALYVANFSGNAVTVYAPHANGDARPIRTIAGPRTKLHAPISIAVDAGGAVYVADRGSRVLVYAAGADGDVAPSRIIWGSRTALMLPLAVAVDHAGAIYVVEYGKGVVVHAPGANGNASPIRRLGVAWSPLGAGLDLFGRARDVVIGRGDTLFVTAENTVGVYAPGADEFPRPLRRIMGPHTGLANAKALGVDARGVFYALNESAHDRSITAYGADANGDASPARTLAGPHTGLDFRPLPPATPSVVTVPRRRATSSVTVYVPRAHGDARPIRTIEGPHTGFGSLFAIQIGTKGELYALSCDGAIAVHASDAHGDARPIRTLAGRGVQPANGVTSFDLALGPRDSVYVASTTGWGGGRGYLEVYPPDLGRASERPRVSARWLGGVSLAVDARDVAYVGTGSAVHAYAPGAAETAPPFASLTDSSNGLFSVGGLAISPRDGMLYTANRDDAVRVYAPIVEGAPANQPPIRELSGASTGLRRPGHIALDATGALYVVNTWAPGDGNITVYAPGASGDTAPVRTIGGPHTRLAHPHAIAVDARGFLYVANTPDDESCFATSVY